jgi:hypothetical protein
MKDAPVAELLLSYQQVGVAGWLPVIDGPGGVFSATPSILYAQGNLSHIPFITGDVLDEGSPLVFKSTLSPSHHRMIVCSQAPTSLHKSRG